MKLSQNTKDRHTRAGTAEGICIETSTVRIVSLLICVDTYDNGFKRGVRKVFEEEIKKEKLNSKADMHETKRAMMRARENTSKVRNPIITTPFMEAIPAFCCATSTTCLFLASVSSISDKVSAIVHTEKSRDRETDQCGSVRIDRREEMNDKVLFTASTARQ